MSIRERKTKEQAKLRQKILRATLRVFATKGYGNVSMRKIAALIDYSPTTIYRFFRSKEELLGAIAAGTYGDLATRFEKVKAGGGADPLGALRSLVKEYIVFCVERPEMFKMYSDLAVFEVEDGAVYERLGGARYRVYQSWFACIRALLESGRLAVRDEMRAFLYLWDAAQGYIDHRVGQPGMPRGALDEDAEAYLELVFRGIERSET